MSYNFWLLANILKNWKPNDQCDHDILARLFWWALEYLIAFYTFDIGQNGENDK